VGFFFFLYFIKSPCEKIFSNVQDLLIKKQTYFYIFFNIFLFLLSFLNHYFIFSYFFSKNRLFF